MTNDDIEYRRQQQDVKMRNDIIRRIITPEFNKSVAQYDKETRRLQRDYDKWIKKGRPIEVQK